MLCREPRLREPRTGSALSWSASARHQPVHRHEVSPATANLAGQTQFEPLASFPGDPFGSDHARAISPRPSTSSSMDAIIFDALVHELDARRRFLEQQNPAEANQRRQPRSAGHPQEASNRRASMSRSYAGRFGPYRFAAEKTTRSWTPGRQPRSKTCARFGCGVSKCQRPREAARRPHGTLGAGFSSTCRFPPWGKNPADIKENVHSLAWVAKVVLMEVARGDHNQISVHTLRQHAPSAWL